MSREEQLRTKLLRFVDGLTPLQLEMLEDRVKVLIVDEAFGAANEKVWLTATGRAGTHREDWEEGSAGTLYRNQN